MIYKKKKFVQICAEKINFNDNSSNFFQKNHCVNSQNPHAYPLIFRTFYSFQRV